MYRIYTLRNKMYLGSYNPVLVSGEFRVKVKKFFTGNCIYEREYFSLNSDGGYIFRWEVRNVDGDIYSLRAVAETFPDIDYLTELAIEVENKLNNSGIDSMKKITPLHEA